MGNLANRLTISRLKYSTKCSREGDDPAPKKIELDDKVNGQLLSFARNEGGAAKIYMAAEPK